MITSDAAQDEQSSSFYKKNKAFCELIEQYLLGKGGKCKGKFNAWSYIVLGEFKVKNASCSLTYKKSTYSSGNLLSKFQNLYTAVEWTLMINSMDSPDFIIRKKKTKDRIARVFIKNFKNLFWNKNYIISIQENESSLVNNLSMVLEELFASQEINEIEFRDNTLTIKLNSDQHHFGILDQVISSLGSKTTFNN